MIGLCDFCFASNVEVTTHKGKIRCRSCTSKPIKKLMEDPPDYKPVLQFENLPRGTLKERTEHIERVMADLNEKWFARYLKNERISEPLIDRIHDT